jgi:tRNA threonylcarbamoyl adenosine modification protein YeaZ
VALRAGDESEQVVLGGEIEHARDLLVALEELRAQLQPSPRLVTDIDAILVGTGPGSYTGLRVGIATAFGLARGSAARLRAVPSFDALAYRELAEGEECSVLWNAYAGRVYAARYRRTRDEVVAVQPVEVRAASEARELLGEEGAIFLDPTLEASLSLRESELSRARTELVPRADAVLELGLARLSTLGAQRSEQLLPLYLQPFTPRAARRS